LRGVMIVLAFIAAVPASVLGTMMMAVRLSAHAHEFGPWDPRYLLLVQGSDVSRLNLLEPVGGSVRYTAQGQEGISPARVFVEFITKLAPEQVLAAYEARCAAIGLIPKPSYQDSKTLLLSCDGSTSEIGIRASRLNDHTSVTLGRWIYGSAK
jgi:hypothetical protein